MTQNDLYNETEIRRFLLGEMSEDERRAFEESFIGDETLFDRIRVGEDDLVESYVRGILDVSERKNFEKSFLTTKKRRERVIFTREMIAKLPKFKEKIVADEIEIKQKSSVWILIAEFFKTPKLTFGAVFAILLTAFGFWFLVLKTPKNNIEIVRQTTPTPISAATPQIISNQSDTNLTNSSETNKFPSNNSNLNKNQSISNTNNKPENPQKNEKPTPPPDYVVTIALFAGTVRSEGKMSELNLPERAKGANLQLNLESQDYKIYRLEIADPDGKIVYRSGKLIPRKSKVNFFVPAQKLQKGDYLVKLYGINSAENEESAADYSFRVNRR